MFSYQVHIIIALLAPLIGAIAVAVFTHSRVAKTLVAVAATVTSLVSSLVLLSATWDGSAHAVHMGGWQAPFGIVLVADGLASVMLVASQLIVLASIIFCHFRLGESYYRRHLIPLVLTLLLGSNGAFLTGDLFNLYVWFEVLLLSSFAIMALMRGKQSKRMAWNYIVMNLISSFLFLMSIGIIYGTTGILNLAHLRMAFEQVDQSFVIDSSATLLFAAFAIKSALIPMAFWLPGSYPKLPAPLAALFGAILTKVGLYAYYRVFGMVFSDGESFIHQDVLLVIANITMIGGVLGAMAQKEMKAILSFHIISQVGYMALALALYTPLSLAAGLLYLFHHIIAKGNLFFACDLVEDHSGTSKLGTRTGISTTAPMVACIFAISALALAGLPPLSGFFAKFALLQAAATDKHFISLLVMALVGFLTLFSMVKIWRGKFWGSTKDSDSNNQSAPTDRRKTNPVLISTAAVLAAITVTIGVFAEPILKFAEVSTSGIKEPVNYIEAVTNLKANNPKSNDQ